MNQTTTRHDEAAECLTGDLRHRIRIEPMDQPDALILLQTKVGGYFDKDNGIKLVDALDYMPLAIMQAAAFIHRNIAGKLYDDA